MPPQSINAVSRRLACVFSHATNRPAFGPTALSWRKALGTWFLARLYSKSPSSVHNPSSPSVKTSKLKTSSEKTLFDSAQNTVHQRSHTEKALRLSAAHHGFAKSPKLGDKIFLYRKKQICETCHSIGDDAVMVRNDAMAVADGVGGWNDVGGANPSLYSVLLLHHVSRLLKSIDSASYDEYMRVDLKDIVRKAFAKVKRRESLVGSTTLLLSVLRNSMLHVYNMGDCSMLIIRDGGIVFRTEELQHSFNFPYQIGTGGDDINQGVTTQVQVQEGDIVISGTDGVFDNLFDNDIVSIVNEFQDPQEMSKQIAMRAKEVSEDTRCTSPFMTKAVQEGMQHMGGKRDDISVVVGVVMSCEDTADRR